MGISHCLLKPVRQTQLFDAIADALQTSNPISKQVSKQVNVLPDYSGKQILVAEDNNVNQKVILALLARFQLKPDVVENGQEVLDQLARQRYDLVLMDCQMPVMDGYEATCRLRALELTQNEDSRLPIVALTAHAAVGERDKCLSAGMDDYLSKPLARDKLAEALERCLGESVIKSAIIHESKFHETIAPLVWDEALALKSLDDDEDLLTDIIALFLDEVPAQLAALIDACRREDMPTMADIAHRLKGMAGHFCANIIVDLAGKLEYTARHNKSANFIEMTEELIATTRQLVDYLLHRKGEIYE